MTATATVEPTKAKFTMPRPDVGDDVLFYENGDRGRGAIPATVIRVFDYCIDIVSVGYSHQLTPKKTVLHIDDPRLSNPRVAAQGAWEPKPSKESPAIKDLRSELKILSQQVEALQTQINKISAKKTA